MDCLPLSLKTASARVRWVVLNQLYHLKGIFELLERTTQVYRLGAKYGFTDFIETWPVTSLKSKLVAHEHINSVNGWKSMEITRETAIRTLNEFELEALGTSEREALLAEAWGHIPDIVNLSQNLRDEYAHDSNQWSYDPRSQHYDELILTAMSWDYVGVRNEFILGELRELGHAVSEIIGLPERLAPCPCCGWRTLAPGTEDDPISYDICGACFWQDDGLRHLDERSDVNRMCLRTAQANFQSIGAVDEQAVKHVDKRASERYFR